MDAFFASIEQRDDPALRGRPVLVGGDGRRGVVAAASYEARAFGCHSAQPMAIAKRRCPHAVIVPPRGDAYGKASRAVFAILEDVTPLVEPLSIDEAFLDVTGSLRRSGPARDIAVSIKERIRAEVDLIASVGIAPCKFFAKLASDLDKPDGLTVLGADDVTGRIAALPIARMWGVGPAAERRLVARGVHTFADLQRLTPEDALSRLGRSGPHFRRLALGEDDRTVTPDHQAKSIGHERTFARDLPAPHLVRDVLLGLTENVAWRLRRRDLRGRTITLKIRYGDFETITRSTTLDVATDRTDRVREAAAAIFDAWARESFRPVRLIGVSVSNLGGDEGRQLDLFKDGGDPDAARAQRLDETTDRIKARFGRGSIRRGVGEE